jgi:hypothetical protein
MWSFHQPLYTTRMGGGGTGLRRRGSRLDSVSPSGPVLSRAADYSTSMQVGYHNQAHKDQHGEHGRKRGEP